MWMCVAAEVISDSAVCKAIVSDGAVRVAVVSDGDCAEGTGLVFDGAVGTAVVIDGIARVSAYLVSNLAVPVGVEVGSGGDVGTVVASTVPGVGTGAVVDDGAFVVATWQTYLLAVLALA